jgi:ribonuclease HI
MNERLERILGAIRSLSPEHRAELFRLVAREYDLPIAEPAAQLPLAFEASELAGPADYVIVFDGGSQGNPGPAYGSYRLTQTAGETSDMVRLEFGSLTSNEAEYETLIAALEGLIDRIEAAGGSPGDASVEIRGDSALAIRQVEGTWKAKDDRMRALRNRARTVLARFKGHRLILHGREESVRTLGH